MQPTPSNPYGLQRPPFPPSRPAGDAAPEAAPAPPTAAPAEAAAWAARASAASRAAAAARTATARAAAARALAATRREVPEPDASIGRTRRARIAAVALLGCATAMALGIGSFHWFSYDRSGLGLGGIQECFGRSCHTMLWSDLHRLPGDYALLGYLAGLSLAGAIALALHAAIVLLAGAPRRVRTSSLDLALGVAAFATIAFWLRVAAGYGGDLGYGYSGFLAIAGVIVAAVVVHRLVRGVTAPTVRA